MNEILSVIGVKNETPRPEAAVGTVDLDKLSFWPDNEEAIILKEQIVPCRSSYVDLNAIVKDIKKICEVLVRAPVPSCEKFLEVQKGVFDLILSHFEMLKSTDASKDEKQKLYKQEDLDTVEKKLDDYKKSFDLEKTRLEKAWSEVHATEIQAFEEWKVEAKKRVEDQIKKMKSKSASVILLQKL